MKQNVSSSGYSNQTSKYGGDNNGCPSYASQGGDCCFVSLKKFSKQNNGKNACKIVMKYVEEDPDLDESTRQSLMVHLKECRKNFYSIAGGSMSSENTQTVDFILSTIRNFCAGTVNLFGNTLTTFIGFLMNIVSIVQRKIDTFKGKKSSQEIAKEQKEYNEWAKKNGFPVFD